MTGLELRLLKKYLFLIYSTAPSVKVAVDEDNFMQIWSTEYPENKALDLLLQRWGMLHNYLANNSERTDIEKFGDYFSRGRTVSNSRINLVAQDVLDSMNNAPASIMQLVNASTIGDITKLDLVLMRNLREQVRFWPYNFYMPDGKRWGDGWLRVINIGEEIQANSLSYKLLSHHARKQLSLKPHQALLKAAKRPAAPLVPSVSDDFLNPQQLIDLYRPQTDTTTTTTTTTTDINRTTKRLLDRTIITEITTTIVTKRTTILHTAAPPPTKQRKTTSTADPELPTADPDLPTTADPVLPTTADPVLPTKESVQSDSLKS